eukprot:scaffold67497_cov30-Prasinocladus_malaysianus.AAC.1
MAMWRQRTLSRVLLIILGVHSTMLSYRHASHSRTRRYITTLYAIVLNFAEFPGKAASAARGVQNVRLEAQGQALPARPRPPAGRHARLRQPPRSPLLPGNVGHKPGRPDQPARAPERHA